MVIDLDQVLVAPEQDDPQPSASTSSPATASVPDAVAGTSVAVLVPDAATEGGASAQGTSLADSVPDAAKGPKWPLTNCNTCNCTEDWRDMHAKKVWEEGVAGRVFTYARTCAPCFARTGTSRSRRPLLSLLKRARAFDRRSEGPQSLPRHGQTPGSSLNA
jgi:hypothetical protein